MERMRTMLKDVNKAGCMLTSPGSSGWLIGESLLGTNCPSAKVQISDSGTDGQFLPSVRCEITGNELSDDVEWLNQDSLALADHIIAREGV